MKRYVFYHLEKKKMIFSSQSSLSYFNGENTFVQNAAYEWVGSMQIKNHIERVSMKKKNVYNCSIKFISYCWNYKN